MAEDDATVIEADFNADQQMISALEGAIEQVKAGELSSILMLAISKDHQEIFTARAGDVDRCPVMLLIAELEVCKLLLMRQVEAPQGDEVINGW